MLKNESKKRMLSSCEMDLKPFMNLMVVLIPMLLVSAEFARVAIVDIKLPSDSGVNERKSQTVASPATDKLSLTAIITDSVLTLGAKGGFLPSIHYREYHQYIARDDRLDFTIEYKPGIKVYHPVSGREMKNYEREDIHLYLCDENHNLIQGIHDRYGEILTDKNGNILTEIKTGDTAFTMNNPVRTVVIRDIAEYELKPVSAYDEFQNRLNDIRKRFSDATDKYDLIIAADNMILYDKLIQTMDRARAADYRNISISKLRT